MFAAPLALACTPDEEGVYVAVLDDSPIVMAPFVVRDDPIDDIVLDDTNPPISPVVSGFTSGDDGSSIPLDGTGSHGGSLNGGGQGYGSGSGGAVVSPPAAAPGSFKLVKPGN